MNFGSTRTPSQAAPASNTRTTTTHREYSWGYTPKNIWGRSVKAILTPMTPQYSIFCYTKPVARICHPQFNSSVLFILIKY